MPRLFFSLVGLCLAALAFAKVAVAQEWPLRPVTMVIPFAAGGALDVLGRILQPGLSEALRVPVVIENVGGAGGMIGASRVAKAPPDGYQFVLGGASTHAVNQTLYKKPLYNAATDFGPVMLIIEQPLILTARKDFPADHLQQFITYVKANQSRMQYGSGGAGSTPHLACALLNTTIGVEVTHVPYRGTGPATQDLIAGRIDYMCPLAATAIPQIAAGQIKPIAILSKNRSPLLSTLTSAQEQGFGGFEASTWNAAFLPKATPRGIVQKLHDATEAAIDSGSVQEQLKNIGATVVAPERRSPEYLAQFVQSEIAKWAAPIKAAGIQGD